MKVILFIFVSIFLFISTSSAEVEGKLFPVTGERIDITPPDGWKLAWMRGQADGDYLAEYAKDGEEVTSWKSGLLVVHRLQYPSAAIREQISKANTRIADVALFQAMNGIQKNCKDKYRPTVQRVNTYGGLYFAVGGWYCGQTGPVSPYGEGAYVAFVEGRDFVHFIQYGWRPQSEDEVNASPWAIDEKKGAAYLKSIISAVICAEEKKNCTNSYIR